MRTTPLITTMEYSLSIFFLIMIPCTICVPACNYKAFIKPGSRFRILSPNYPHFYQAGESCTWSAVTRSDAVVHLRCPVVSLAHGDYLLVTDSGDLIDGEQYYQAFEVEGNPVFMELVSNSWAGGFFQCEVWAEVKNAEDNVVHDCECGWSYRTRIVGGVNAGVHEFPSMAALVNRYGLFCGAVIIAKRVALTAAHSILGREPKDYRLLIGEHDISTGRDTNASKLIEVNKFISHEGYLNGLNDIALIITKENIDFTARIGPACLPFRLGNLERDYVQAVGWGMVEYGGAKSDVLLKTFLQIIPPLRCQQAYKEKFANLQHICTYFYGQDSCQGDSGGPLYFTADNRMYVVGVISNGIDCGGTFPAVNTRVSYFIDWINSKVPNAGFCVK